MAVKRSGLCKLQSDDQGRGVYRGQTIFHFWWVCVCVIPSHTGCDDSRGAQGRGKMGPYSTDHKFDLTCVL